uniref:BatD family protein n=1 Tax=Trichloromonas sp. TaxID=3069249 RepID=UPI003D819863
MVRRYILMALALLLLLPPALFAAQVTAVPDRDRLGAGESLQLELRVNGSPDDDPDLAVLERDWEILNRSQSSQMQLINGSLNRSLVLSLSLMPRR